MSDTIRGEGGHPKADEWAERIAAQQRSGISVKQFCKEQGLTEYSFYAWRKRLQKKEPVRFALVDRGAARQEPATEALWNWYWRPANGCASAPEWMPLRCARSWKSAGMIHLPASVRVYLCLTAMRHAQEL